MKRKAMLGLTIFLVAAQGICRASSGSSEFPVYTWNDTAGRDHYAFDMPENVTGQEAFRYIPYNGINGRGDALIWAYPKENISGDLRLAYAWGLSNDDPAVRAMHRPVLYGFIPFDSLFDSALKDLTAVQEAVNSGKDPFGEGWKNLVDTVGKPLEKEGPNGLIEAPRQLSVLAESAHRQQTEPTVERPQSSWLTPRNAIFMGLGTAGALTVGYYFRDNIKGYFAPYLQRLRDWWFGR